MIFLHLSIACRKNCGEEVEQVTVTFEHILRFTADAKKKNPFLVLKLHEALFLWNHNQENFFLHTIQAETSWSYKRQRTCTN